LMGLRAAECIQRETHRVPSSSVFGGLRAEGKKGALLDLRL
jgi:hypothetical protein